MSVLTREQLLEAAYAVRQNAQVQHEREELSGDLSKFIAKAWTVLKPQETFKDNWHIHAIAEHLQAVTNGDIKRLQVWVPPGTSKPVDVDALVLLGDGSRKRLGDIEIGDSVITHTGKAQRVTDTHEQGLLKTLLITTESGRSVRAAPDHPFLTPTGWKQAADLIPGDVLGTIAKPQTRGDSSRTNEEFRLLGYFIGDGNCTFGKNSTGRTHVLASNITCFDEAQGLDIIHCAESMGFSAAYAKGAARRYNISGGSRKWLREIGLAGHGSWTKRFPEFVFCSSNENIAHALGAYFACDGTLGHWRDKGKRSTASVIFNSVNRELLADVQHLLLRFGVKSRLREHTTSRNNFVGHHTSWRLPITSYDDTSKFISSIPVIGAKAKRLEHVGVRRSRFDETIQPDEIVSIEDGGLRECRCLTVEKDHSFTANDLIVKNSLTVSVFWPAWEWTFAPHLRYWGASYEVGLAGRLAAMSRDLMLDLWYQERWGDMFEFIREGERVFGNNKGGTRLATAPNSTGSGEHGHRILIDDPINAKSADATSRVTLDMTNDWYDGTVVTRGIGNDHARVIIMQRLHEDDLASHVLDLENWDILCLPERYEPNHPFVWPHDPRTVEGELLWPDHRNETASTALARALTTHRAAGQLQQRPAAQEGEILKRDWWRFYDSRVRDKDDWTKLPAFTVIIQSVDCPVKDKQSNDNVASQIWGCRGADRYLLDLKLGKMNYQSAKRTVKEQAVWARQRWRKARHYLLIENAGYGVEMITDLKREISGVTKISPAQDGDKVVRATTASDALESGNCFLPGFGPPWQPAYDEAKTPADVAAFIQSCASFPNATHDDDVDAWSQTMNWLRGRTTTPMRTGSAFKNR